MTLGKGLFQLLAVPGFWQHSSSNQRVLPMCVCKPPPFTGHRTHCARDPPYSTTTSSYSHLQSHYFWIMSPFEVLGVRASTPRLEMETHNSTRNSFQSQVSLPMGKRWVTGLCWPLDCYRQQVPSIHSAPPASITPLSQMPRALLWVPVASCVSDSLGLGSLHSGAARKQRAALIPPGGGWGLHTAQESHLLQMQHDTS